MSCNSLVLRLTDKQKRNHMMERFSVLALVFLLLLNFSHYSNAKKVIVNIKSATHIAETDENFVCATMDWWPTNKCDYDQCPWGEAGILNLDLNNQILQNAIKAFSPLRLRIGGSLQDQVIYKVGEYADNCKPFNKKENDTLFGFTDGCLEMERWDQLSNLFNETGALVTFGLNALIGRQKANASDTNDKLWVGAWDSINARDFIMYNINKGYKIDSWELGNELCGDGVGARIEADQYGKDMIQLRNIVNDLYPSASAPKVLGPAGFYDKEWFNTLLQVSGPGVIDGVTHHIYNLGAGNDPELINKIQDPYYLSRDAQTFKDVLTSVEKFGPWSGAWVGEGGGAYNSGGKDVSHTFVDGFWYLDQLGMTSTFNHKVYCRQAFIGGNYALLNTTSFIPNPDYYGALLWHRLMGKKVLGVTHESSPYLRVYSHCSKNTTGITVLIINMSKSKTFKVHIVNDMNMYTGRKILLDSDYDSDDSGEREEYHLTPKDGDVQSDKVLLNNHPIKLTDCLDIPKLKPKVVDSDRPITVRHHSIVFATLKGFNAPACSS